MSNTEEWPRAGGGRRLQPFASFRYRNYRWLWAANVSYGLVQSAQRFAFVWVAIETLQTPSSSVSLIILMVALPALLLTLPAGVLTDRMDMRRLLATSHVLMALTLVLTAILSGTQAASLGLLLVMGFLAGIGGAVGEPVRAALVPVLVPKSRLLNANALYPLAQGLGEVLGPALTGVAIALWGAGSAFTVLAAVIAGGALFLIPLRVPPRDSSPPSGSSEHSSNRLTLAGMVAEIADGFRFAFAGRTEVRLLFVLLLTASLLGPWLALDIGGLKNQLDVSPQDLSWLFALGGAGGLVTVLILASIPRLRNAGGWYGVMLIVGTSFTALIWFSSSYALVAVLMLVFGLAQGGRGILFRTLVQSQTPTSLLGRAMSTYFFILAVGTLLGSVVTWGARDVLQGDALVVFAALVILGVTVAVMMRNPGLRRMPSHPEPVEPGEGEEEAAAQPG